MRWHASGPGGVRPWRFLAVTAPATVASLAVGALAILGHISVVITSAEPITMASSGGTSDSMVLGMGGVASITGVEDARAGGSAAAMVEMGATHLEDLCLVPVVRIPVIDSLLTIRLRSTSPVTLGDVTLAATGGRLDGLRTPRTTLGETGDEIPGQPGAFQAHTDPGRDSITLGSVDLQTHGLVLDGGLRLSSLGVRASTGDLGC